MKAKKEKQQHTGNRAKIRKISAYADMPKAIKPERTKFPISGFPKQLQALIVGFSKQGFSLDYVGASFLAAFSGIAGNNFKVQVKPGWIEPSLLWIALVGDPGTNKTQCIDFALEPIWKKEESMMADYERAMGEYELAKEAVKNTSTAAPDKPKLGQCIIQQSTIEALFVAHKNNPSGLIQHADELIGWLNSMNQYRKGSDGELWLQIYNNGRIRVNRISREPMMIKRASVSVIGGIQPDVIKDLAKENKKGNGFVSRILYAFPDKFVSPEFKTVPVSTTLINAYDAALMKIHPRNLPEKTVVEFHPEASEIYADFYTRNQRLMRLSNDAGRRQIYSKLNGQLARIALSLQLSKMAYDEETIQMIMPETMKEAIKISEYFRFTSCFVADTLDKEADNRILRAANLIREGKPYSYVAGQLGVSKGTLSKWKKKFPEEFE